MYAAALCASVRRRRFVQSRSLIVATGVQYRRLDLPNLAQFEGAGVYYGATAVEAQVCADQEVAVVGGGNSAGQAALFLSTVAKHVYLLVRRPGWQKPCHAI